MKISPPKSCSVHLWMILATVFFLVGGAKAAETPPFIWLESENPTEKSGLEKYNSWPHEYFSGEWLNLSVDADNVEKAVQGDAIMLKYDFSAASAGNYELWNRVGLEYIRSPFDWRVDGGDWKTASPEDLTIDLMEVGFWCEIAWLKLGNVELSEGNHRLEIRVPKRKKEDGKWDRIIYASDCLCFYKGNFEPYSKYKPGEDHRTEKDRNAAKHVFEFRDLADTFKSLQPLDLAGTWEICRDDEYLPEPVTQPISRLPNATRWSAIQVPGDKNELRPDLQFAHRVWYRTKIDLPQAFENHSAYIEFPQNNLNTTVYVNGQLCGFNKNPYAKFCIDISKALKPGVNEIYVGIRDAWYARTEKAGDPMKLRRTFNYPKSFFHNGFQDLVYPVWSHPQSGILIVPTLHFAQGPVYVDDVFVKPSVANKELTVDITLKNTSDKDQTVELSGTCWEKQASLVTARVETIRGVKEVRYHADPISDKDFNGYADIGQYVKPGDSSSVSVSATQGEIAKKFESKTVTVKANSEMVVTLKEKWENPKLWTPEKPFLYGFMTSVKGKDDSGKDFTTHNNTSFGFREWSISGKDFLLNGVPFHGRADCFEQPTKEKWLQFYRDSNQSVMRFWGTKWQGMPPEEALRFFDENGVVCRRSGVFDGEAIGYNAIENDPELRAMNKAEDPTREEIKMDLFRNWRDQVVAQVKAERNHPSVMIWSIENEILYINCINLFGGLMDQFEDEIIKTARAVKEVDPTRASMVDGGGATKRGNPGQAPGDGLEVAGDHYVASEFTKYPDLAYEVYPEGGGRGRWIWDANRPRFIGEDFYVNGYTPAEFAVFGGEEAFGGRTSAKRGVGIIYRMLTEGYRWNEYGAWQFWTGQDRAENQYGANAPVAVLCKEWDWTFAPGETVKRTMKIFNDTFSEKEIRFTYSWKDKENADGLAALRGSKEYKVAAGKNVGFTLDLRIPKVKTTTKSGAGNAEAVLVFQLAVKDAKTGKWTEVFQDEKNVHIISLAREKNYLAADSSVLYTYDPKQSVEPWLKGKAPFKPVKDLEALAAMKPSAGKAILLVGKDALEATDCDSPVFQAFASAGNRVIVLEQKHPLRYGALACEMEPAKNEGRTAFMENESHPIFAGLTPQDFFCWTDGHVVYRDAYKKPTRGARSLLQCDARLENSAIVEVPVGSGLMILSQVLIGEKLEKSVVAKKLVENLILHAAAYQLKFTPVAVCTRGLNDRLRAELDAMQLKYITVDACVPEVASSASVMIVSATPENLKTLAGNMPKLKAFYDAGGTLLLHGLTPDGLDDYNQLVGFQHMIRPFGREKVSLPAHRHPLTLGLSLADVAMSSGERMFGWANDEYIASDTYTYVVDYEDVAPFAQFSNDFEKMMSNGMVSADGWPYIVNLPVPDAPPHDFSLKFSREQELVEAVWIGNVFYSPVTKIGLFFDGKSDAGVSFDVAPNAEPQNLTFPKSIQGKDLTLRLEAWTRIPGKENTSGLDNIQLMAKRPAEFLESAKPLLNIGAIMSYRLSENASGGIVMCNLNFKEHEAVALNALKKRNILAVILRNLGAEFAEAKTIIAGTPLKYETVDISNQCNGFRNTWFGDRAFTFAAMPTGEGRYAGVPFMIYDFPTSPVPNCVMLRDEAVRGIPVNKKADAVFFLHTGSGGRRRDHGDIREGRTFEMFRYAVRYADGQTVEVPVVSEIDIEDYRRTAVEPISGATLGWVRAYEEKLDEKPAFAAAYVKQWTNPRPEVEIASVDMIFGEHRSGGQAALLGITVATEP